MKVAIITDTHYGARKGSQVFQDYFELFYNDVFFPTLEQYGIDTVIHMGDAFDTRKAIDYSSLEWSKRVVFDPLSKYNVHMVVGNHDTYYKNTNEINSPELLLKSYPNIKTYASPGEVNIGGLDILFLPWINENNETETYKLIESSVCKVAMGHLELNGFRVNSQIVMDHGHSSELYSKFTKVFSGHYHTRSDDGRIFYLGNPYEMFWSDVGDRRGFTIFDTETLEHFPIDNPHQLFHIIKYNDEPSSLLDTRPYKGKYVKVIVQSKSKPKEFDKFLDKIYKANPFEVKIVETFHQINEEETEDEVKSEDTLSLLDRYILESEVDMNKAIIKNMIREVYQEACEMM